MAQWIKALTLKPDHLNSIPKTHVVDGEKNDPLKLFSDLHMCHDKCSWIPV